MRTSTFIKKRKADKNKSSVGPPTQSIVLELVEPKPPGHLRPCSIHRLPSATVAGIRLAMEDASGHGPWQRFLREVCGCYEISAEPWMESSRFPESQVQRIRYVMPIPRDLPDS